MHPSRASNPGSCLALLLFCSSRPPSHLLRSPTSSQPQKAQLLTARAVKLRVIVTWFSEMAILARFGG